MTILRDRKLLPALLLALVAGCGAVVSPPCAAGEDPGASKDAAGAPAQEGPMVSVRVFNAAGELVGPVSSPRVEKSDAEWKEQLTPEEYRIMRGAGTERPFCGTLLDNKKEGVYTCVGCGLPLFSSDSKFKSGTGWPSFFEPVGTENVAEKSDDSLGMTRTEIKCARCDGHLGHVFEDGPRPTGLRYCLNSEALAFTGKESLALLADPAAKGKGEDEGKGKSEDGEKAPVRAQVVFAGGCFWCVEAVFEELDGVEEAVSGYAGGTAETANYKAVCTGRTGHAEAVRITYDPNKIAYEELLEVHFATHDPTTRDRQGADVGPQYRSSIFFANAQEKELAQAVIADLTEAKAFTRPIVTTLEPLGKFYPAESYHQNYACLNPSQPYIRGVAMPKVAKVRAKFKEKLKARSPLER